MDNDKYKNLLHLRIILYGMERDLGLGDLSKAEMDIFLVAQSLTKSAGDVVRSHDLRNHEFTAPLAPATFHRGLRSLLNRGLLRKADGSKAKDYIVNAG